MVFLYILVLLCSIGLSFADSEWINYPESGFATMTHYGLPLDAIAACGCVPESTHFPTAALSQMAYGSSMAFGPGCGHCFNLTLLNTFLSNPPFYPNVTKSVVVKITDLCPLVGQWCSGTGGKPNPAGHQLNFDLAWPSTSIPNDFFPSDVSLYGYDDFGVWNISYTSVPCEQAWAGASNSPSVGPVSYLGSESVCCPSDPVTNSSSICASYSDLNGIPREATPGVSSVAPLIPSIANTLHALIAALLFRVVLS